MVVVEMGGGLGNQLFKYAFARSLALKLDMDLKFDLTRTEKNKSSHHTWYKLDAYNIPQNFATAEEIASINPTDWKIMDKGFLPIKKGDNVYIRGSAWLQHEEMFIDIADIVRHEVTLKNPLSTIATNWEKKILAADCAVSLHVRLGDYMFPSSRHIGGAPLTITFDFFDICINLLKKVTPSVTLFIFSDDLEWCKENLKFDVQTEFVEGCEYDFEDMYLMSCCKHNIVAAASTFSWWGAWLNPNPDKIVFFPPNGNGYIANHTAVIPYDPRKRRLIEMSPMLSIIVYVENNLPTIPLVVQSILSQSVPDYEIILVDASTDGSGDICRKVAVNKGVTLLTVSRKTTKISAWNQGLDIAHGDHVVFITGKEFLFSSAIQALIEVCDKHLWKTATKRDNYITYATYGNFLPNIICFTKFLEEDAEGTIEINPMQNKKFSIKTDAALKNLNGIVELSIPANQKLMALATQGINNFIGTKFFKREFLNANHIRFSETGGGTDAELRFLVDAFLATEKIVFVPNVFCGRLK